ncbi:sigma-70 family RNA polymerase sigma factor [Chitinophaga sp. 212800010-3]|uniref:RNA polymerase sigma factor n=1 Tax=unclassified Chitinophaga TaxID=2619133 RepID=UPI002DF14830|nr:Sigma-70 family RNA polymerase sigma factor [Chitinophaga sp. 212800010-3]
MEKKDLTPAALLSLIRNSDKTAFEILYQHMWEPLFIFAMKRLGCEEDAEDAVQEVFTNLWNRRHQLKVHNTPEAYLFSAVRYEVINCVHASWQHPEKIEKIQDSMLFSMDNTMKYLLAKELNVLIDKEVQQLPAKMREIYLMGVEQHRSVSEIAAILHLSEQTIRNQLNLARGRIKTSLKHALPLLLLIISR